MYRKLFFDNNDLGYENSMRMYGYNDFFINV